MLEGKKILVVDDSEIQRKNLRNILQKYSVEVFEAENGIEGIKKAFEVFPDLVISDVVMPELNGYGLSFLLKNNPYTSHIPIIILTSQDSQIDKFWGEKSGCDRFLIKGIEEDKLIKNIEELITQKKTNIDESTIIKAKKLNPQSFLLELFDETFKQNVLNKELYNLHNYVGEDDDFIKKIFSFLALLFDYIACWIYKESFQENVLILKIEKPFSLKLKNDIKEDLIKITSDNSIFSKIKVRIFNKDLLSQNSDYFTLNKTQFSFSYESEYKYSVCIYHKKKIKYPIVEKILESGLKVLFNVDRLIEKAYMLSIIDGLTGAFNRRYLEEILKKDFDRFVRYNHIFSIIMMDIDHFKKINDTYGHQAGDEVLKHLVKTVKNIIRSSDIIARYGGEEFCVVIYGSKKDDAIYIAERIRNIIKNSEVAFLDKKIKYTVSFGVSTVHKGIKNYEELLRKADTALYRAKNSGRDRVEYED